MKTGFLLLLLITTVGKAFSESSDERLKRRMQLREEMHQKMRDSLFNDFDASSSFQKMDQLMDELMKDAFSDFDQSAFQLNSSNGISTHWRESEKGRILTVKTEDKDAKVDVQVNGQKITLKTEYEQKSGQGLMKGQSTQMQTVPHDCDGDLVKMEATDKGVELFFPYKTGVQTTDERRPIEGNANDIQT